MLTLPDTVPFNPFAVKSAATGVLISSEKVAVKAIAPLVVGVIYPPLLFNVSKVGAELS